MMWPVPSIYSPLKSNVSHHPMLSINNEGYQAYLHQFPIPDAAHGMVEALVVVQLY